MVRWCDRASDGAMVRWCFDHSAVSRVAFSNAPSHYRIIAIAPLIPSIQAFAASGLVKYWGSLPGYHLMLHPMLGRCCSDGFWPASTASAAARRSAPFTGTLFFG